MEARGLGVVSGRVPCGTPMRVHLGDQLLVAGTERAHEPPRLLRADDDAITLRA